MTTLIHDLLDLPEAVRKGDFVQSLAAGIASPEATVRDYAITAGIVSTFEHSLSVLNSALTTNRSQAAYLHGSFGSGKSHFMAVLSLMLADHPAPWARSELHPLRTKHPWIGTKKLLQLPTHFLGAASIEDKLFSSYVAWVDKHHPEAPIPALYSDEELFANADQLRADMGDERFFAKMNAGKTTGGGWGDLGGETWTAERFDRARASTAAREREELFSDLVKSHFTAFAGQTGRFVDLDRGLEALARHAKGLGYDGVVLYLDELLLWLASSASDIPMVERESQKLVKLKEGDFAQRAVPIVSFIARQRDWTELVGETVTGNQMAALRDSGNYNSGRFEEIKLADSNLPAIVKHRVVRTKDDEATGRLTDAFERAWRSAGTARGTLVGADGDKQAFDLVYPFSPVLVDALVALGDCLQRERTAIRVLMELLVEHLPGLALGPIVPVGDAFDVLAGGEEPFDQYMKKRFESARSLYQDHFLPLLQNTHGTANAEQCQRLRSDHKRSLGCSGCPQASCRNDNRLAKTILMAALVPEAKAFKDLTVRRLCELNHGTIASPIPGAEVNMVVGKLRDWAAKVGALRLGDQGDPSVSVHLQGVDLGPIIDRARQYDTPGQRKQKLRALLFSRIGLPADNSTLELKHTYLGTSRPGTVRFANVRETHDNQLRAPSGTDWYLVIDYPFDDGGTPADDLNRVDRFRDETGGQERTTVVWLPSFFNHEVERTLGDYVALEHILDGRTSDYLGDLRPEDKQQAEADLRSLRDQKKDLLIRALKEAYGVATLGGTTLVDPSRAVENHLVAVDPSLTYHALLAGSLKEGFKQVVDRLLEHRFPHHPRFETTITQGKLTKVADMVQAMVEADQQRIALDNARRKDLKQIGVPLGIAYAPEGAGLLKDGVLKEIDRLREQAGKDCPSVEDVRNYTDPDGQRGLTSEVADLLTWLYAAWAGRTIQRDGRLVSRGKWGQLPAEAELVQPDLPSQDEWARALDRAGELFGITTSKRHLSAQNVAAFSERVRATAASVDARGLKKALGARCAVWGPDSGARMTTAGSAAEAVDLVVGDEGADLVRALAAFTAKTSASAVGRSLASTAKVLSSVRSDGTWLAFESVKRELHTPGKAAAAEGLLQGLKELLEADEINRPLVPALKELTARAVTLIKPPKDPEWVSAWRSSLDVAGIHKDPGELAREWEFLRVELVRQIKEAGSDLPLRARVSVTLERKEPPRDG